MGLRGKAGEALAQVVGVFFGVEGEQGGEVHEIGEGRGLVNGVSGCLWGFRRYWRQPETAKHRFQAAFGYFGSQRLAAPAVGNHVFIVKHARLDELAQQVKLDIQIHLVHIAD